MKRRIAIDMDEVLADTLKARLERYEKDYGVRFEKEDFIGKHFYEVIPEAHRKQTRAVLDELDFFRHLEVFPYAQEVVRELNEQYDVFIATAAMEVPFSFTAKYDWLLEFFPFLNPQFFVFCGDKGIVAADYLIDDNFGQLTSFQGEGILYGSPSNANKTGFKRVEGWLEVKDYLL